MSEEAISTARVTTREELKRLYRTLRPRFLYAVAEDVDAFCAHRNESRPTRRSSRILTAVRLCWQTDAFLGLLLYRARMALFNAGFPVLPKMLHHLSSRLSGISIGDWAVLGEGIYIPHGQIVVDGLVKIGRGVVLCPWTTIGLQQGNVAGPTLAEGVFVGTGAKVLGDVKIGAFAKIGANSVVVHDVQAGATAVGVPARVIEGGRSDAE